MNKRPLLLLSLFLLLSSAMLVSTMATAQATDWAPPNADSPTGGALTQIYLDSSSQIKDGGIGLDTGNTLLNLPAGTGLYASTGAVMVDWPGASQAINASPGNAISSNGRIRSNGVSSTGGLQSDVLKSTGAAEKVVCVDLATGKLKLCGIALGPVITFTANPTGRPAPGNSTLTWSTTTAVSCVGTNFSTGPGSPPNGSVIVWVPNTTTYTVTCTDAAGQSNSRSVTVTINT